MASWWEEADDHGLIEAEANLDQDSDNELYADYSRITVHEVRFNFFNFHTFAYPCI